MADPTYDDLLAAAKQLQQNGNADGAKKMLEAAVRIRKNQPKSFWEKTK